jgi:alpha-amylase
VEKRRWQTPKPNAPTYQTSFQDYHSLVGYADIKYVSTSRNEADVCIVKIHKNPDNSVQFKYFFNGLEQPDNCKRFNSAYKDKITLKVIGSDGTQLDLPPVHMLWNQMPLKSRLNDGVYRDGQKGAVAELFGWPHKDVAKECEILGKAGYLGVKLFPVHEQLMSTQPFNNVLNPWYYYL